MNHYEERLTNDIAVLHEMVGAVARDVAKSVSRTTGVLLARDRETAAHIILADGHINRATRRLDRKCHAFVATHLPSAGHLRFVTALLHLSVALERIGDYAVTIARETVQLAGPVPPTVARDVEMLSEQALRMFEQSMRAFQDSNAELARGTRGMADQFDSTFSNVFEDLLAEGEKRDRSIKDLFAMLVILNRLERISDQSKNICEETIFAVTGETKTPKVYRVLFVDAHNSTLSQMAERIARKAFPESGLYSSAGWEPAAAVEPAVVAFMDARGFDMQGARPRSLAERPDQLDEYHVVVVLEGDAYAHFSELPFKTVLLSWDPGVDLSGPGLGDEALEAARQSLALEIRELMETLRGEGAA